jgi:diketogulonate reductase-like aldo/keto reductase
MSTMKYETLSTGEKIPRLGFGTWKIGGGMFADTSQDEKYKAVIRTAIELGYTHIDTSEMYAGGHTERLIGQVIKDFNRQDLLISTKVWEEHLRYQDVLAACAGSLERLDTDTIDWYLIHLPSTAIPLEETFQALNELVEQGKVRRLGVSNFNLAQLKQAQALAKTPIVTNQVPYSLRTRKYVINGVLEYCQANDILLTAHSPVERGTLLDDPELHSVAQKYGATPAQIALAWLVHQPKVITIPMSTNPEHLKSNLEALEIELFPDDMERLDKIELPEGSIWQSDRIV